MGPKIDLCGTPKSIFRKSLNSEPILVFCWGRSVVSYLFGLCTSETGRNMLPHCYHETMNPLSTVTKNDS